MNLTSPPCDVTSVTQASLYDVKKTAIVAATAALITAQALQNQIHTSTNSPDRTNSSPGTLLPT